MAAPQPEPAARLETRLTEALAVLRELAGPPEPPLSDDEIRHLHAQFTPSKPGETCQVCGKAHPGACQTCGGLHGRACPRVRSVEYEVHGDKVMIRKVEYWPDGKWSTEGIVFADELPPLPEESS